MDPSARIFLKPGKEQSVMRLHPWVFSGAVGRIEGRPEEGDAVSVFGHEGEFLAMGHYQKASIMVRIFTFDEVAPDEAFWDQKLRAAWRLREALGLAGNRDTNVYRLVNGEGDGMPGLIIDYYDGTAVLQSHSIGMYRLRNVFASGLRSLYGDKLKAIYDKSENTVPSKAGLNARDGFIYGDGPVITVRENGCLFSVDVSTGQKTGFFIDQRDNRHLLSRYARGRDVLNMFCYTGGFSVYALAGGARLVHSVDSSAHAMTMTAQNAGMNPQAGCIHEAFQAEAFNFMGNIRDAYDLIILDPPAFAKHQDALANALQAYKRLNARAIEQIRPGGILFTFSCSQVVSRDNFRKSVFAASANTGRHVRILHQLSQPPDHPVSIYHPEGEYLKGLVLQVE